MRILIKGGRIIDPGANTDGIRDILIEDGPWTVRFAVLATGEAFGCRRVLLAPHMLADVENPGGPIRLLITPEELASAPDYDALSLIERWRRVLALRSPAGRLVGTPSPSE